VAAAVRETPVALVFGHDGGGTIRGAAQGPPWADPEQFAGVFNGARVWVYAGDTRGRHLEEDLDSFGRRTSDLGVAVFAGHCSPIPAVPAFETLPALRILVYGALGRAFRAFVGGTNSASALRLAAARKRVRGRRMFAASPVEAALESLRVKVRSPCSRDCP
jgi:hypothetical protein